MQMHSERMSNVSRSPVVWAKTNQRKVTIGKEAQTNKRKEDTMPQDVEKFGELHDKAKRQVLDKLDRMLPSEIDQLVEFIYRIRRDLTEED